MNIHIYLLVILHTCDLIGLDINITGQTKRRLPKKHWDFSFIWYENAAMTMTVDLNEHVYLYLSKI